MVTTKLIGRLGNQIFQIAATISYAKKHSMPYWIPQRSMAEHIWPACFKHFPQEPKETPFRRYLEYKEPAHHYTEIPRYENVRLEGFFQSDKYFIEHREEIIKAFQIPYKKLVGYVSLHIRRGDYLQMQDKHPVITYEYISEAVKFFIDKGYSNFIVCSDDLKWCRISLKPLELFGASFQFSNEKEPIADLALMSCCEHNIISNSSFSWWSGWLNQNPDKIVIAPKVWFGLGNSHLDTKDLIPESWLKL